MADEHSPNDQGEWPIRNYKVVVSEVIKESQISFIWFWNAFRSSYQKIK